MSAYLAEVIGPCYSTDALCAEGISLEKQDRMVKDYQLLRLVSEDGIMAYPFWQFKQGTLEPVEFLPSILSELAKGIDDTWAWALWLLEMPSLPRWIAESPEDLASEARNAVLQWKSRIHRERTSDE